MKTIKNLWRKEWELNIKPSVYIYIYTLLSAILLAPNYPYFTVFLYTLIGVIMFFTLLKTNNDITFSAILPVARKDIVKSKFISILYIEGLQILTAIPFAIISALVVNPNGNLVGLDSNISFFASVLIEMAVFNLIFLPIFFKTSYRVCWGALFGMIGFSLVTLLIEGLIMFVPSIQIYLDGYKYLGYQTIFLSIGIIIYALFNFIAYKLSIKNFEKVNL